MYRTYLSSRVDKKSVLELYKAVRKEQPKGLVPGYFQYVHNAKNAQEHMFLSCFFPFAKKCKKHEFIKWNPLIICVC